MRFPLLLAAGLALVAFVPAVSASTPNCNHDIVGQLCDASRDALQVVCATDPAGPDVDPLEVVQPVGPTACYLYEEWCDGLNCVNLDCILYGTHPNPLQCFSYCISGDPGYIVGDTEQWLQGCMVVNPDKVEQTVWDMVEFVQDQLP